MGCLRLTYEKEYISPLKVVYRDNLCIKGKRGWNSHSIDPYEQYHSPYKAMDNAWHMSTDPDGGGTWNPTTQKFIGDFIQGARAEQLTVYIFADLPKKIASGNSFGLDNVLRNGMYLALINAPDGAGGLGHNALMIGNDDLGWDFYSKEGRQAGSNSENNTITGGPADPVKTEHFNTVDEMFNKDGYKGYYKKAAVYKVETTQSGVASTTMVKSAESNYNIATNNCSHACADAMSAVGLDPGYVSFQNSNSFGIPTGSEMKMLHPSPNVTFNRAINNNSGRLVSFFNR
jgi:hypothetical protein